MRSLRTHILLLLLFLSNGLQGSTSIKSYNGFRTNPYTTKEYRKTVSPYLMPANHPIKEMLDEIFTKNRVTSDLETFKTAGFQLIPTNQRSHIVVARHPALPGYIVKVALDSEKKQKFNRPSWVWLARRCELANKIRAVIRKQKCYLFTVAQKWIYPLPTTPPTLKKDYERKNEILVVTDMELANDSENEEAWKNMTKTHLKQLYTIITYAGGCSYRKDNIPVTKSGKFAFIDTEYPHRTPNYQTVIDFLSPEMRKYWMRLVDKGGLVY
ncbi:MAG: hypothetical protein AAGG81_00245 [Chlamydiota bacterium]